MCYLLRVKVLAIPASNWFSLISRASAYEVIQSLANSVYVHFISTSQVFPFNLIHHRTRNVNVLLINNATKSNSADSIPDNISKTSLSDITLHLNYARYQLNVNTFYICVDFSDYQVSLRPEIAFSAARTQQTFLLLDEFNSYSPPAGETV